MIDMEDIGGYHAHVYYDETSFDQAKTLLEAARDRFGLIMGRMHRKLVGPHPRWSCQLILTAEQFGAVIPWLNIHRGGLTVFVHPLTHDDLYDHRDAAIWLGDSVALNLDMFLREHSG